MMSRSIEEQLNALELYLVQGQPLQMFGKRGRLLFAKPIRFVAFYKPTRPGTSVRNKIFASSYAPRWNSDGSSGLEVCIHHAGAWERDKFVNGETGIKG
jgi:hypothetical protein